MLRILTGVKVTVGVIESNQGHGRVMVESWLGLRSVMAGGPDHYLDHDWDQGQSWVNRNDWDDR